MLFSVNRLVSAWLSNISVGGGEKEKEAFYSVLNSFNLNLLEWNRQSMGESDCTVISIYYWIGLQQNCVCVCFCLCADLFKSIMFLCVCTVYAHRLTFTVPRLLSPLCLLLSPFVLPRSFIFFFTLPSDYLSLFSSHFPFNPSPSPFHPFIRTFIHSFFHLTSLFSLPLQCVRHVTSLLLQSQPSLQQPALKLMAESGDEQLLQLTRDQINSMTAVSVIV